MASIAIKALDALKAFRGKLPEVQTATPVKTKDKETGAETTKFDVKKVALDVAHILSAVRHDDGRVSVVTIDGQRHEARGQAAE